MKKIILFFNDQSSDYSEVSNILDLSRGGRIDDSDNQYTQLLNYLENKVNVNWKKNN